MNNNYDKFIADAARKYITALEDTSQSEEEFMNNARELLNTLVLIIEKEKKGENPNV